MKVNNPRYTGIAEPSSTSQVKWSGLLNAILVVAALVITLLVGEMFFRLFYPQPIIPRYVETSPYGIRKNIGNVRGTMIVPEYRHAFSTNSRGFRGTREYAEDKPAGVYRIIVLGDSVTLGHGVSDDETFSYVLEQRLSDLRPTEVINMGVSGFGTAEELIQLRAMGLAYQPDLVILTYFPNDPYNNMVSKLFRVVSGKLASEQQTFVPAIFIRDRLYSIPGYSFLCQHSHLVNFVRNRLSGYFTERLADQNNISSKTTSALTHDEAELTTVLLNEVVDESRKHDLPLIILNIPLIADGELIDNFPGGQIDAIGNSLHVIHADNAIYAGHTFDTMSYKKDSHPKPLAHKLIGEYLAHFIQFEIWSRRS